MSDQRGFIEGVMAGFGRVGPVTVRETLWGYVVESVEPGGPWRALLDRAVWFMALAVWLAVTGLWFWPFPGAEATTFALKSFASVGMLALTYLAFVFTRRQRAYAFQIDTNRRELRAAVLTTKGRSWIKASYRFDEIGEAVLQLGHSDDAPCSLCLRLKNGGALVPVADGDETTLLAVHDRLMGDLRPMEERMAAFGKPKVPVRTHRIRSAFLPLGPDEIRPHKRSGLSI